MSNNKNFLITQRNSFSVRNNNFREFKLRNSASSFYKNICNSTLLIDKNSKFDAQETTNNYTTYRSQSSKYQSLTSTCWCLFDTNKNVELGFRQSQKRQIASLTKIMTTIVGLQFIQKYNISLSTLIRVTESSTKNIGTSANLKINSWIFLKDIFYGIMLPSGNDAAYLLSQFIGYILMLIKKSDTFHADRLSYVDLSKHITSGYVAQFIKEMNLKAHDLKMYFTRFSNPHGLQNAMNISTAKDMLILSIYCSKNKTFRKIMNAQEYKFHQFKSDQSDVFKQVNICKNTNILLKQGWQGIKTGQTIAAGSCLASLKNGVYIVVLNCANPQIRFTQTKRLYQWYISQSNQFKSTYSTSSLIFQS